MNYFDYDISIDSTNAIFLTPPKEPGDAFTYDDYGVKPAHCIPEAPPFFEYHG
jgi:primary-amine oxidase